MSTEHYSGRDRRTQTLKMVDELLEERKQVWSSYCAFAGFESSSGEKPVAAKLNEFCQLLIDYVSLGHFGIYQRITDGTERRRKIIAVAESVYPRIAESTDCAVDFNDRYAEGEGDQTLDNVSGDLSKLGEALAMRIELEDRLIEAMRG